MQGKTDMAKYYVHCNPLQGQYRVEFTTQGKPCFHYREPLFSLQGPCIHHRESCIHYREFPVRITTQGNPCSHYREWVCSEGWCSSFCAMQMLFQGGIYLEHTWFIQKTLVKLQCSTVCCILQTEIDRVDDEMLFLPGWWSCVSACL